jgi:hypothetical protein
MSSFQMIMLGWQAPCMMLEIEQLDAAAFICAAHYAGMGMHWQQSSG